MSHPESDHWKACEYDQIARILAAHGVNVNADLPKAIEELLTALMVMGVNPAKVS